MLLLSKMLALVATETIKNERIFKKQHKANYSRN